jgi:hypothetical protein
MNVGIIAACLPTLKPLAADFFGAVSALTSGERYGSRGHTKQRSRLQVSKGYLRQSEGNGTQSYNMDDLKGSSQRANPEHPRTEIYGTGNDTYTAHGRRGSRAGDSDESDLLSRKGIMRTTEVEIK